MGKNAATLTAITISQRLLEIHRPTISLHTFRVGLVLSLILPGFESQDVVYDLSHLVSQHILTMNMAGNLIALATEWNHEPSR